jgi:hypothetical protein
MKAISFLTRKLKSDRAEASPKEGGHQGPQRLDAGDEKAHR